MKKIVVRPPQEKTLISAYSAVIFLVFGLILGVIFLVIDLQGHAPFWETALFWIAFLMLAFFAPVAFFKAQAYRRPVLVVDEKGVWIPKVFVPWDDIISVHCDSLDKINTIFILVRNPEKYEHVDRIYRMAGKLYQGEIIVDLKWASEEQRRKICFMIRQKTGENLLEWRLEKDSAQPRQT